MDDMRPGPVDRAISALLYLLAVLAALFAAVVPAHGGGCDYGYSSYPSYSYPSYSSYSAPAYYAPPSYTTVVEKPVYIERVVEKPVYVAQYAPLLVNVPTYAVGYSACQQQAAAAPAYQQQVQQQAAAAPAPVPQPATPPPAAVTSPAPSVCETRLADCQSRLARLESMVTAYTAAQGQAGQATGAQTYTQQTPSPAAGTLTREAPRAPDSVAAPAGGGPTSAAAVFSAKCSMCHANTNAAKNGGGFVLGDLADRDGQKQWVSRQLNREDWQKVVEQVATGKMPRKPAGATPEEFDKYGKLTPGDFTAIFRGMRAAVEQ